MGMLVHPETVVPVNLQCHFIYNIRKEILW